MDESAIRARIDALLSLNLNAEKVSTIVTGTELFQGALTVLSAVYGTDSLQVSTIQHAAEDVRSRKSGHLSHHMHDQNAAVLGALQNLKAELAGGLAGSLEKRFTGDVLTDMIRLARTALDEPSDGAKNVAAVLAAAAFEDTIRRMGTSLAGVLGRDDLSDVIQTLKEKGILQPPQLGIALSYLNFRNRALHADWETIEKSSVESVLGFVEQLLLKHFK